jgi:hypothetical protein
MKKGLLIGGGAVIVVVVIAVVFLWSSLDSIVKAAIETYGSEATQAKVTVNDVSISPTSGSGALKGLVVGNPQGFKTPQAFRLGEISLKLDTGSITGDTILIKEIVIAAPEVTYELAGASDNIRTLRDNADRYAKSMGAGGTSGTSSTGGTAPKPAETKDEGGKKLIIENLYVRSGKVNVAATVVGGKSIGANLPDIHLKDIGKAKGGATPAEVVDQVLGAITQNVQTAVRGIGLDQLKDAVGPGADQLKRSLEGGTRDAPSGIQRMLGR